MNAIFDTLRCNFCHDFCNDTCNSAQEFARLKTTNEIPTQQYSDTSSTARDMCNAEMSVPRCIKCFEKLGVKAICVCKADYPGAVVDFEDTPEAWTEALKYSASPPQTRSLTETPTPEPIEVEARRLVTGDRQAAYSHPIEDFTRTAKIWSGILGVDVTPNQVAMCMVGVKLSRECHKHKRDSMVDAVGYLLCLDMVLEAQGVK